MADNNYSGQYGQQGYQQNNQQGYQQYNQQQGYQQGYQQQGYQSNYQQYPPYTEYSQNNAFNYGPSGKSRGVYAILALILGSIGLHYFYSNKAGAGILTILLVIVTCGFWAIIPLIQGILAIWTLTNEEFEYRFASSPSFFPFF